MFSGCLGEKPGGKIRKEVSLFFILIPNSTGNLFILPSMCSAGFVLYQEYCIQMKFVVFLACIHFFTSEEMK